MGRRPEQESEIQALTDIAAVIRQPRWTSRLRLTRASLLALDGRFADAAALVAKESGFLSLVMASHLAVLTGDGLEQVEKQVREALDGAPYHLSHIQRKLDRTSWAGVASWFVATTGDRGSS